MSAYELYWSIFHLVLGFSSWTGIVFIVGNMYGKKIKETDMVILSGNVTVKYNTGLDLHEWQKDLMQQIRSINGIPKEMLDNKGIGKTSREFRMSSFHERGILYGTSVIHPRPIVKVTGV